jgi:protein-S-isoprenylcysteine O-methyltransferase Ste14
MSTTVASQEQESGPARADASGGDLSFVSSLAFVSSMIGAAYLARSEALAVYALSFWHYGLYGLAFVYGAVSPAVFKRDAITMKTVALAVLAGAYLTASPDLLSLGAVAAGFSLNALGARALGSDRTYYGHEVAGMPRRRITAFPYSWISHPMLVGNIAAFGGTMLNPAFRERWWPLAGIHVAMNTALLLMEVAVEPRRGRPCAVRQPLETGCGVVATAALLGGSIASREPLGVGAPLGALVGACVGAYACVLYFAYAACPSRDEPPLALLGANSSEREASEQS